MHCWRASFKVSRMFWASLPNNSTSHPNTSLLAFLSGDLERGESIARQRGNLVATVWRDRRLVYVMSTNSDPTTPATVQRKEKDGTTHTVSCPRNVVAYNKYMGGVDHADQLRNYYHVRCKSRKFYRYLFWFAFDCAVVNAFILWKNYQPLTDVSVRQQNIKHFRIALANGLIGSYNSRQRYAVPTSVKEASIHSRCPPRKRARTASSTPSQGHIFPSRATVENVSFAGTSEEETRD